MAKAKLQIVEPTLPYTPVTIDGKEYKMCFDFDAIGRVEQELRAAGDKTSLIFGFWSMDIVPVRSFFAASLRVYHPEIAFEDAKNLVTWRTSLQVVAAITKAREQFMPDEEESKPSHPHQPGL